MSDSETKVNSPPRDEIEMMVVSPPSSPENDDSLNSDLNSDQINSNEMPVLASGAMVAELFEDKLIIVNLRKQLAAQQERETALLEKISCLTDQVGQLMNKINEFQANFNFNNAGVALTTAQVSSMPNTSNTLSTTNIEPSATLDTSNQPSAVSTSALSLKATSKSKRRRACRTRAKRRKLASSKTASSNESSSDDNWNSEPETGVPMEISQSPIPPPPTPTPSPLLLQILLLQGNLLHQRPPVFLVTILQTQLTEITFRLKPRTTMTKARPLPPAVLLLSNFSINPNGDLSQATSKKRKFHLSQFFPVDTYVSS